MIGLVLGSGLGEFGETVKANRRTPYAEIEDFPRATAAGHKGEFIVGSVSGTPVAVMSGRFHLYEGYSAQQITAGIRLFRSLGVRRLILTNAAGGIRADLHPGTLVLISDHINLQGANPLMGAAKFVDMTEAYSPGMRSVAQQCAPSAFPEGVYAGVLGPSYETPAEIRFLRAIGADLVGMSTVQETIAARHLGMEVLGISCVTNVAAGLSGNKLSHSEVLEAGARAARSFIDFLNRVIPELAG